ncbi:tetraacyldisaccharide 4'-kinase [Prevotella communis]|uniref:tetraacyldisaccharide 4'-kinase n=1 Tax=Prevotella communis TaxID=2913614 RepID=UPI001EDC5C07|nr:tetraacyldisaccharide 4'-kinase [Prevotella communis]UKK63070.1 tetraacyldisaccharide 4'-kinase [Prevotella communis]UKK65895.1 tetraacyldisaccharide 4'-kinase [Prevotella communis]
MEGDFIKINRWLQPLSWFYGLGVRFRNTLFETGFLKSRSFSIPVISVGNITVGGTGKTPHVEYLIRLLQDHSRVAVLSRGYKRKSHGFQIANESSTARTIGDEPFQMKQKFPKVIVAVDKNRVHGIEALNQKYQDIDVILLDDAFQHRYVKPGINILLVDYHRLIIYDTLLPAGRLREPLTGKNRADMVIITKCPKDLKPMEYRVITKAMDLYPYQQIFFTTLEYGELTPLFKKEAPTVNLDKLKDHNALLLTGIASPRQMKEDLTPVVSKLSMLSFPDHHAFSQKDIEQISSEFAKLLSPKCIITTEKDAARIIGLKGLCEEIKENIYILPVRIKFMLNQEEKFNDNIIGYVRKNSRNSILVKRKDDNKPKDGNHSGDRPRTISFRNN